jgi:hypothetical protein
MMIAFEQISAQIAAEGHLAAITPQETDLDTAVAITIPVLGRLTLLDPTTYMRGAALTVGELLDGSFLPAMERFNIPRAEARRLHDAVSQGADAIEQLDAYLTSIGVTAELWSTL